MKCPRKWTFALLPDTLITLVTASSLVLAVLHFPGFGAKPVSNRGSEVFEHFCLEKKKMVVSFLFTQHSDFSCQFSEVFFILSG